MKFKSLIPFLLISPLFLVFSPQKAEARSMVENSRDEYMITNNSKQTIRFRLANNSRVFRLRSGETASYRNMNAAEKLMVYTYSDGRWHMLGERAYQLETIPFLSMERSTMDSEDNTISFRME